MTRIRQVAVVVPARDEEALLPRCLDALAVAAERSSVPARTIVVLDSCGDASAGICRRHRVETIEVAFANVGRARHAGITHALQSTVPPSSLWIANTDADSRVPPDWLTEQVRLAEEGADAVVGLVDVSPDVISPDVTGPGVDGFVLRAHKAAYSMRLRPNGAHEHVHGANLGIRASTYLEARGFPPVTDHEDRQLVLRLKAMRRPVVVTTVSPVVQTSGRTGGRCREGFACSLAVLDRRHGRCREAAGK